jgi:hypothetical protein
MLAFALSQVEELFHALIRGTGDEPTTVECAACGTTVDLRSLGRHGEGATEVLDDGGRLAATCPSCRRYRVWHLEDMTSGRARRSVSPSLRAAFTDAVADGLPLHATEPCTYLGPTIASPDEGDAPHARATGMVAHRFRSGTDGRRWTVHLPASARVLARPGQDLEPDRRWAWGLDVPEAWHRRPKAERVRDLTNACGGNANLAILRSAWFHAQGVRLPEDPGHVLFPADLVAPACADVRPAGLWWDLTGCVDRGGEFLAEAEAFVLPPVRLVGWDRLSLALPGEVRVDAAVGDPRFRAEPGVRPPKKAGQIFPRGDTRSPTGPGELPHALRSLPAQAVA